MAIMSHTYTRPHPQAYSSHSSWSGIASLCLVADFDFIERGVERGAPKQLEWRAAFGLMVTLIWLYLEILKLLAKLAIASRR